LNSSSAITFLFPSNLLLSCSIFIAGLIAGSFLNVVVYRLPIMLKRQAMPDGTSFNLCFPPSHCPRCRQSIRFWQNIPLLSWLLLHGKCHRCHVPIPVRYPLTELSCALLFLGASFFFTTPLALLSSCVLSWFLLALSLIDIRTYLLPDMLTLPLLWLGLIINSISSQGVTLNDALYGAVAGYLALWVLFWWFRIFCKKEGMGYGDFKFLSALGGWVGWQPLPYLCIMAAVLGVSYSVMRSLLNKTSGKIPFGPCLALAGGVVYISQGNIQFWLMIASFTNKLIYCDSSFN